MKRAARLGLIGALVVPLIVGGTREIALAKTASASPVSWTAYLTSGGSDSVTPTNLAATSELSTRAIPMAPRGVEDLALAIPWASVGPGWFVALWGPRAAFYCCPPPPRWDQQPSTLYLVDPLGGRYRITTFPAPSDYRLFGWSGDGRRVLIGTPSTGTEQRSEIENIDLASGKVLDRFTGSNSYDTSYQYTWPKGLAVLRTYQPDGLNGSLATSIVRQSLSGATLLRYPTTLPGVGTLTGGPLPSLDGMELVVEATKGMALVDNDGTFVKDVGPRGETCSPAQWWDATDLVASCFSNRSSTYAPALWLVPNNGKAASQLTFPSPPDYGDLNGWKIGSTVYLQAAGACASEFLARRLADGKTMEVSVPKANNDVRVVGAHGSQLALLAVLGCGSDQSLFWFNPTSAKETPLLGPPLNAGSVLTALPYPGLQS